MSMFFGHCGDGRNLGTWWVSSETDPRWNKSGRDYGLVCLAGPDSMQAWIDECRKNYGEPPADCYRGFIKD